MDDTKTHRLLKTDKYQVLLFSCPCNIPFNFAEHHWFVTNKQGQSRDGKCFLEKMPVKQAGGI